MQLAVKGMLPAYQFGRQSATRLKIYKVRSRSSEPEAWEK